MTTLRGLADEIEREARRAPFDVCLDTYRQAAREPLVPILCAGALDAPLCCVGRELGREEVAAGEPLVGMGGRRLRRALHDVLFNPARGAPAERRGRPRGGEFDAVLERVLLTNLVPYRPVDNRAYDRATVDRFRPFVERLLADHWTGATILALGETATRWFAPYAAPGAVDALWEDGARRFVDTLPVTIRGRTVTLAPVPHPSPLSPFKAEFSDIVARRVRVAPR